MADVRDMQENCTCSVQPQVQLLDTNTSNQIAAGEVVEKPASVVKELVENALDAGATQIEVTIFAGGTEYIRVEDNGCGMNEENARLAVLRHATSKLRSAEDLLSLSTLGFRGEALPSIASVSNFTLLTRPADDEFATSVHIDGGENTEVTSAGGSAGTTVIVENLFFNVPARRKFLKTNGTEGRYISELLTKLALSRPDVRFKLTSNDKEVLSTPGDGDLSNAIRALYGKSVSTELLTVDFKDPRIEITGFIGKPTLLKGNRSWQTMFVNGRSIGNKMLAKAIDHAYQSQIPKSGYPFAVLNIVVDTHSIDVNVHPQKSEIKFSDDSSVYKAMYKALTDALTRPMNAQKTPIDLLPDSALNAFVKPEPKADLATAIGETMFKQGMSGAARPVERKQERPAFEPIFKSVSDNPIFKEPEKYTAYKEPMLGVAEAREVFSKLEPFNEQVSLTDAKIFPEATADSGTVRASDEGKFVEDGNSISKVAEGAGEELAKEENIPLVSSRENIIFQNTDEQISTIWPIGQVDKTFIIAQSEDTLYLIDQHAAHERILYDRLVASHEQIPAQQLLMPLYIDLDDEHIAMIEERHEEFLRLGVDAAAGGEGVLRISSLPADIKAEDAEDFIYEISKMLGELRSNLTGSDLRQEVLHMTACKAAIKAGQLLNMRQMRQLIIELCNTTHPFTCPHGRPCMIEIDSNQLYKMFKRTGF